MLFGGVQFTLTPWGFQFPTAEDWVPLLVMALVVGVFESVFFRGFVQNRLEARFGHARGIGGAAALYGLYHVGYGMGPDEILFLTGLGVIYAAAFSLTRSIFVLWPLLTPLGSFFANVRAGDIDLPWASIAGFLDVLGVMVLVVWLAHRHVRRRATRDRAGQTQVEADARATRVAKGASLRRLWSSASHSPLCPTRLSGACSGIWPTTRRVIHCVQ